MNVARYLGCWVSGHVRVRLCLCGGLIGILADASVYAKARGSDPSRWTAEVHADSAAGSN